jgi:hypothetical protein
MAGATTPARLHLPAMRLRSVVAITLAFGLHAPSQASAEGSVAPAEVAPAPAGGTTGVAATAAAGEPVQVVASAGPVAHEGEAPPTEGSDPEPAKVAGGVPRARAEEVPAWENEPAERRGGFAMGLSLGLGLGAANGFPNDAKKIGREAFYTESGVGFATASSLWIGGALADWLNFGVGGGFSRVFADGVVSDAPLLIFHADFFPLYGLGGAFRDVAAMTEMGLGFPKAIDTTTDEVLIEGGGASYVFVGAAYEGLELGPLRMGPYLGVHSMFSESIRRPLGIVGFRATFYGAP